MPSQVIKTENGFLDGGHLVPDVNPVKIDVVSLQTAQACVDGLHHALAMIARRIRVIAWRRVAVFGGEHNTLPVILNELSDEPFARTVRVHIRGVDEVSSGFAIGV